MRTGSRVIVAGFAGLCLLAGAGINLRGQELDKVAIPRPEAERERKEERARQFEEMQAKLAARAAAEAAAKAAADAAEAAGEEPLEEGDLANSAMEQAIPPELADLLPVGAEFKGVRFPSYTGDRLNSIVHAEKMSRIDSEHLDLFELVIDVLDERGKITTKIYMDRAVYDIADQKLISRSRATIDQKPKFVMKGDKLTFEGETKTGRMQGNVKTIIYGVNKPQTGSNLFSDPSKR
ncbi:MAG: hypothetical protein HKN23_01565 [Verrucomicrobiales bacterium]|nr:hypothetical protein [Verrucomicrobiales bacterium]